MLSTDIPTTIALVVGVLALISIIAVNIFGMFKFRKETRIHEKLKTERAQREQRPRPE